LECWPAHVLIFTCVDDDETLSETDAMMKITHKVLDDENDDTAANDGEDDDNVDDDKDELLRISFPQ